MIEKVDLVMWTKNGEQTLPKVLSQIEKVIPQEYIHKKIMADDHSTDITVNIGKNFDWVIYENPFVGISSGANKCLKHVVCDHFISIEQDVILANDWWNNVPKLLDSKKVAIASGIRTPDKPIAIKKLQEYVTERYRKEVMKTSFIYGKTLDNTIYNTQLLRKIGGFPKLKINAGIDTVLAKRVSDYGLEWKVDFNVRSVHLRKGLSQELKHYYWYGTCQRELKKELGNTVDGFSAILLRTGFSPIRGLQVAYRQKCWQISYVYPLIRISTFLGFMKGYL